MITDDISTQAERVKKGSPNTQDLKGMAYRALSELRDGKLDQQGQAYAADVIGEHVRRLQNTLDALFNKGT